MSNLDATLEVKKDVACLSLSGELDMHTLDSAKKHFAELVDADQPVAHLDLTQLRFMDSMGLGALLQVNEQVRQNGHSLAITPSSSVSKLLRVTGLDRRLRIVTNPDEL